MLKTHWNYDIILSIHQDCFEDLLTQELVINSIEQKTISYPSLTVYTLVMIKSLRLCAILQLHHGKVVIHGCRCFED